MREELKQELERIKAAGQFRDLADSISLTPGRAETRGRSHLDFTNWDYFSLSTDPRIRRSAQEELERSGLGVRASRTSSGTSPLHSQCERNFARYIGAEAALLLSTKVQAIFTFITTFCNERDWIIVDETLQSPVLDASYLVNATSSVINLADPIRLQAELEKAQAARRVYLFVEGISPLTGKTANLREIHAIARKYGAQLLVDESSALGVRGERGAGSLESAGLTASSDICAVFGDLSMGFASFGAIIASSEVIISQLVNRSRSLTHEVAMPSAVVACAISAMDITELMTTQRLLLLQRAQELENGLAKIEKRVPASMHSPILSLQLNSYPLALECIRALGSRNILADAINLKLALSEKSVVRFIVNAAHSQEQIELTLNNLNDILPKLSRRQS